LDSSKSPLKKLLKDPLSLTSIIVICIFLLLSIGAYFISPDSTPYANEQHLEIAVKKPGFKISFLEIKNLNSRKNSFFSRIIYGQPSQYISTPIFKHWKQGDKLFVETYTGDTPNNGEIICVNPETDYKIEKRTYYLGTDRYGRCLLSQLIVGTRVSIAVGLISLIISLFIGITLGAIAGYFGGWIDNVIMWLINVVWSIPTVLLVVAITFALGKGFWQVFMAIGLTMWVDIARMVRGQVKSIKEKEYITASKALGFSNRRIIIKHILPNIVGPITVISASNFASAILQEAGLSFLGLGVQPPMPSWGSIIKENYGYIILDAAYMAIAPGIAIMLLVLCFFALGSGIRKVIDVRN
jgi:peptide/nickel transport system permease protein